MGRLAGSPARQIDRAGAAAQSGRMKRRWLLSAFFLLPAIGAGYMTLLSWRTGEDGKWLFGVFTAFFLGLASAPHLPVLKSKPPPDQPTSTRFVPHWFMLLAMIAAALAILATIVGVLRRL